MNTLLAYTADPSGAGVPIPGTDTFETVARKVMRPLQGVLSHRVERASALGERSGGHYERSKPGRRILGRNRRDRPARTTYPLPGILAWTVQLAGTAAILYWLVRFRRTYASASASAIRSILGPLIVARSYRKSWE